MDCEKLSMYVCIYVLYMHQPLKKTMQRKNVKNITYKLKLNTNKFSVTKKKKKAGNGKYRNENREYKQETINL